jgi:hypothetical protein
MTLLVDPVGRKPHSPDPPPPEVVMTSCVGWPLLFSLLAQLRPPTVGRVGPRRHDALVA